MPRICLLSDTHSFIDDQILKLCDGSDEIWHAGDIGDLSVTDALKEVAPLRAVYGNIDNTQIRSEFPLNQKFEIGGKKVWMTHIGGYPNRYTKNVKEEIYQNPPDLFICGHSHILKVMRDKKLNLLHMNPGAIGKHGFHNKRTLLRFNIQKGQVSDLEVAEIDR